MCWAEYRELPDGEKDDYMSYVVPVQETMLARVDINEPLGFSINGIIVDDIIGAPLFDPDDDDTPREVVYDHLSWKRFHVRVADGEA